MFFVGGVCVPCKKNDVPFTGQEGEFAHVLELRGYRHAQNLAFPCIDELVENIQVDRKHPFRILSSNTRH